MNIFKSFSDGVVSLTNSLINSRNPHTQNTLNHRAVEISQLKAAVKSGIGNKVLSIKVGHSLNNTLQFKDTTKEAYYNKKLAKEVKKAVRFMIAYGRGVIVIFNAGDDLSKPLKKSSIDEQVTKVKAFSPCVLTASSFNQNLFNDRYNKPDCYHIDGNQIHHSRVVDFTYIEPPEDELPNYQYGGIGEFEIAHQQLIADEVVQRGSLAVFEKSANWIYKLKDFKQSMMASGGVDPEEENNIVKLVAMTENLRSNYGATVIDAEDDVVSLTQSLSHLAELQDNNLRRTAMIFSIPIAILVGESVQGLNSTGDNERQSFQDSIKALQTNYIIEHLETLSDLFDLGEISFKENQGETPSGKANFDAVVTKTALDITALGGDGLKYIEESGVITIDPYAEWGEEDEAPLEEQSLESIFNEATA